MSAIIRLTPVPEGWAGYYMIGILSLSCLFLGVYIGNHIKKKGFLYGAVYFCYFSVILIAVYMLAFTTGIEAGAGLLKYLVPILFGSVGGMIGVNLRS
jgi:putative membrane protein (TIGR04086 family)